MCFVDLLTDEPPESDTEYTSTSSLNYMNLVGDQSSALDGDVGIEHEDEDKDSESDDEEEVLEGDDDPSEPFVSITVSLQRIKREAIKAYVLWRTSLEVEFTLLLMERINGWMDGWTNGP